jgi:hypothetical protein
VSFGIRRSVWSAIVRANGGVCVVHQLSRKRARGIERVHLRGSGALGSWGSVMQATKRAGYVVGRAGVLVVLSALMPWVSRLGVIRQRRQRCPRSDRGRFLARDDRCAATHVSTPSAPVSPDGQFWWDGHAWHPFTVPTSVAAIPAVASTPSYARRASRRPLLAGRTHVAVDDAVDARRPATAATRMTKSPHRQRERPTARGPVDVAVSRGERVVAGGQRFVQ